MNASATIKPHVPGPRVPGGSRVYAIGDVHGRADLLDALLEQIRADAQSAPERRVLVLLGDLIDRGPDSAGVLARAAALQDGEALPGFDVHILKGNHEEAMLNFLAGDAPGLWLNNGGREALLSYGLDADLETKVLRAALLDALPQAHRRVLRTLELSHVEGDYGFVHAGVRPGVAWDRQTADDLLWIRRDFTDSHADFGCCVVHGHSPVNTPEVHTNRIAVDTRAWASGVLTALVLEGETKRFLST